MSNYDMSDHECKMVVCGSGAVGKSALTLAFVRNHFFPDYDPTIEDSYRKAVLVDDEVMLLDILDTAGQEEFSCMRGMYMRTGDGFVLVYSTTSMNSFQELVSFRNQILRLKDALKVPMILVGNKADLEHLREVPTEMAAAQAKAWGIPFLETSALTHLNVENAFCGLVREIRRDRIERRQPTPAKSSKKFNKSKVKDCSIL